MPITHSTIHRTSRNNLRGHPLCENAVAQRRCSRNNRRGFSLVGYYGSATLMATLRRSHKRPYNKPTFTQHTHQLLDYIESRPILPFRLSKISKECLSKIIQMIHHSSVHMPVYEVRDMSDKTMTEFMTTFEKTTESRLMPKSISQNIHTSEKIGRIVSAKMHGRTIQLYLILPKSTKSSNHSRLFSSSKHADSFFDTCARRIMVWLDVVLRFSGKDCATTLDCYLFLTDDVKLLPKKSNISASDLMFNGGEKITQNNANTAFTYACTPSAKIVLFRMEEWFKVFIHESFHCFGLDFSQMDITESNKQMSKLFPKCQPTMDFRIYETYCETWAETINAAFIAYFEETTIRDTHNNLRGQPLYGYSSNTYAPASLRRSHRYTAISPERQRSVGLRGITGVPSNVIRKQKRTRKNFRGYSADRLLSNNLRGQPPGCAAGYSSNTFRKAYRVASGVLHKLMNRILKRVEYFIQRERMFSLFQMTKILHHHQLTYADLCSRVANGKPTHPPYTEETQVFAYYIVKPVLMFYLNEFIEWCNTHNTETSILVFSKTNEHIREYGELIERLYMLPEFSKSQEQGIPGEGLSPKVADTLRMSLFEMETT